MNKIYLVIIVAALLIVVNCAVNPPYEEVEKVSTSENTIENDNTTRSITYFTHDLDGNGINEKVVIAGIYIYVYKDAGNNKTTYKVGSWQNINFQNLDDSPGKEIGIMESSNYYKIISFRTGVVKSFYVGSWKAINYQNLDGTAGNEIAVATTTNYINIISFNKNTVKSYYIGSWSILQFHDLDGNDGLEMIFDNGSSFIIVDYAANQSKTYSHPSYSSYTYYNEDGKPGDELVLSTSSSTLKWVLNWREKKTYYIH